MPKVVHFEISCDYLERAEKFYSTVFGWKTEKSDEQDDYWFISADDDDESEATAGLMPRDYPNASTINTFEVPSIDSYARRITEAGGRVVAPKMSIPGVGHLVYCYDTEGNVFGIMEFDEAAP